MPEATETADAAAAVSRPERRRADRRRAVPAAGRAHRRRPGNRDAAVRRQGARAQGHPGDRGFVRDRDLQAADHARRRSPWIRASPTPGRPPRRSPTSTATSGILRYRGYPIEQLARVLDLPGDQLPADPRRAAHARPSSTRSPSRISRHTMLHEDLKRFFDGFPRDAHPMPVLSSAVSALSTFYQDALDPFDPEQVELSTIRLLAKLPTIAAYAYKKSVGQPLLYPDNSLGLVENFLRMSFGFPAEPYEVNPKLVKALDQLLILHADHEQNCSTSTVRLVGSSNANLFASVSAGINALFGPLHGGANQAVLEMLEKMRREGGGRRRLRQAGQEQGARRQADGLRAPGLQELRPARRAGQGHRRRGARRPRRATTSCSTWPSSSRRSRSPTTTSSPASSTRTSTSTPA